MDKNPHLNQRLSVVLILDTPMYVKVTNWNEDLKGSFMGGKNLVVWQCFLSKSLNIYCGKLWPIYKKNL